MHIPTLRRRTLADAATLIATAVLVGGCGADGGEAGEKERACAASPPDAATRGAVTLACARAPDGTPITLSALEDAAGPCLLITGLARGARGCGRAPSERVPRSRDAIGGGASVRGPRRLELYGETAARVHRVVVGFRAAGRARPRQGAAALFRVVDREALREAGIHRPFGYFVAFAPPRASGISAHAYARSGARLGRLRFDPILASAPAAGFIVGR